jgi:hypothetical protein
MEGFGLKVQGDGGLGFAARAFFLKRELAL